MHFQLIWLSLIAAILALGYAFLKSRWVNKQDPGNERMQKIGGWIAEGAMAFLRREYRVLAVFVVAVAAALGFSNAGLKDSSWVIAVSFVVGACCSGLTGFIGMKVATKEGITKEASAHVLSEIESIFNGFRKSKYWSEIDK